MSWGGKGRGYTEKYENCCLTYMAVCIITILELSGNLSHYGEEKRVRCMIAHSRWKGDFSACDDFDFSAKLL